MKKKKLPTFSIRRGLLFLSALIITTITQAQNNAINFDGVNDYLNAGQVFNFDKTDSFSVEAWIKAPAALATGSSDGLSQIVSKLTGTFQGWGFQIMPIGGVLAVYLSQAGFTQLIFVQGSTSVRDDNWHYVSFSYDGKGKAAGVQIYLDGVLEPLTITSDNLLTTIANNADFNVGRYDGKGGAPDEFFNGTIDELKIWHAIRTKSQIAASMNATLTGTETGLLAYYNFNQGIASGNNGTDTVANDKSSSKRNATLKNFALSGSTSNWVTGKSLTGIAEQQADKKILVFPNPSSNTLKIDLGDTYPSCLITITNIAGERVLQTALTDVKTTDLDIQNLVNGLYFLEIKSQGQTSFIKILKN